MGTIVNIETGEFVATGDYGNLAEELMILGEMDPERAKSLRLYMEDEAFSEF